MSAREWAYSMIDELADEEFNALMAIVQVMRKNSPNMKKKSNIKSLKGVLHKFADPSKIPLEKTAWESAAVEKHLKFLEDVKNENS